MPSCARCGVTVPSAGWEQHVRGQRHLSYSFFGQAGHSVRSIVVRRGDGAVPAQRIVRPFEVPHHVVDLVRRARELSLKNLFAHSGHMLYDRAVGHFSPERLCGQLLALDEAMPRQCPDGWLLGSVGVVACLAVGWGDADSTLSAEEQRVWVDMSHEMPLDIVQEVAMSCALETLAAAVPHLAAGSSLELRLSRCIRHRHLATKLLRRLQTSLQTASLTRCTLYVALDSAFRQEDGELLAAAALQGWRARVLSVLLGSHARVGAASPLRRLPLNLLQTIVELVAVSSRAQIELRFEEPSCANMLRVTANPPTMHQGADLDHIANFVL
ncbi:hypothetical protein AB1Y20_015090 [Prymnesium parvum]|uniref:Uncharacterized protein n=1 Tax=Prymnesium parvum TaxID=97485 RepID=A0AB34JZJ4_PRYPA